MPPQMTPLKLVQLPGGGLGIAVDDTFKATGVPEVGSIYGEGGLFGTCKQNPILICALVSPAGIDRILNFYGTDVENEVTQSLVYIASTGDSQSGPCADCGKPIEKRCAQATCFGRICQQTAEMVIDDIGLRANPNVQKLALFGSVTDPAGNVLIPNGGVIKDTFTKQIMDVAYNLRYRVSLDMWQGNPAANAGGRLHATGIDILINTGKFDIFTMDGCEQLDSFLLDYNNSVVGAVGSPSIVAYVAAVMRRIRFRANRAGFDEESLDTFIAIHPDHVDCFFNAWACEYGLVCNVGAPTTQDAVARANTRDGWRAAMQVPVDGKMYRVITDSQIAHTYAPHGNHTITCADIYVLTRAVGGKEVLYGEYQDFNATASSARDFMREMIGANVWGFTDGGRFAVAATMQGGFCFDVRVLTKPRIIALMPWLSGRVQNVCCVNLGGPFPEPSGSGGLYDMDGGAYDLPPNYLYGPCEPTHTGTGR